MRYYYLEPTPEKQGVADDYAKWYISRLRRLDNHLESNEFLVDNRFTIADIAVGYALYLGRAIKLDERYKPQTAAYLERMMARPGFIRADEQGEPLQLPERGQQI
jgi:glutathione S-transferase